MEWCLQEAIEELLEQEEPLFPLVPADQPYLSTDYLTLLNLVTHAANRPEDTEMRNTVIAVYLLRFLQHGRYFSPQVPERRKGDRSLHRHERFILRLLHHLVAAAAYNGQLLRTPTGAGAGDAGAAWERLGLSLHTSLSLINHNCDPNVFLIPAQDRRHVLLLAARHIQARVLAFSHLNFHETHQDIERQNKLFGFAKVGLYQIC
jgi:hypothetical protein